MGEAVTKPDGRREWSCALGSATGVLSSARSREACTPRRRFEPIARRTRVAVLAVTVLVVSRRSSTSREDGPWHLEVYVANDGAEPFTTFVEGLDDFTWSALDAALRKVLAVRGIDLVRTEWLKALGGGLHELRVRHDADEIAQMFGGPGADEVANAINPPRAVLLRVFVHFYGRRIILLLGGYDKGKDPSAKRQEREITRARRYLTAWNEQQKLARKRPANRRSG